MNYIETGEIVSVHGIKGEVKVYPWADYPEFLEEFDRFYIKVNKMHYKAFDAEEVRCHKNMVLIKFEGIDTVEQARELIGKVINLDRDEIELEEGTYFIEDLMGCTVINDDTDETVGTVKAVDNFGASDVYTIEADDGKEYMFPAVDEFIVSTDIDKKEIRIKVIEGMFSED
ncbi:MAG: 16S rRNA processing protein RimM [Oscillospiraceae bacterium]|nr:16S rRNA processing protein RimM [Oscillospiraceae bacterium]